MTKEQLESCSFVLPEYNADMDKRGVEYIGMDVFCPGQRPQDLDFHTNGLEFRDPQM